MIRLLDGNFQQLFSELSDKGFIKVRVDGEMKDIAEGMRLDKTKTHNIDLMLDRFKIEDTKECMLRFADAIEETKKFNIHKVILLDYDTNEEFYYTI